MKNIPELEIQRVLISLVPVGYNKEHMHVWALVRWWYGAGWTDQLDSTRLHMRKINDFFSVTLLARNIFQPFRQISAGSVRGGLDVQMRAWLDRLISRMIGAFVRLFMIIAGVVWLCVSVLGLGLWLLVWPVVPILPVIGLIASGVGL